MRKIFFASLLASSFHCFLIPVYSQVKDEPIEIKSLSVDIKSNLFTASTTLDIEFYNPNNKVLDGEYNFSLNDGQVVTGFSLDINGHMREGVITDKQKGRIAYENTIRRRIDPGLLEMTTDNNYKVRVYPMPAKGTRKIKIVLAELLLTKGDSLHYSLPLDVAYNVRQFLVTITHSSQSHPVPLSTGVLKTSVFEQINENFILSYSDKNTALKTAIAFYIPLPHADRIVWKQKTDSPLLFAIHTKPLVKSLPDSAYSSATVFWDVSSSSVKRDIKKDIQFLELFIKQKKIEHLTIVTFSNTIHESRTFHGKSIVTAIRRFMQALPFDGGTQTSSINCAQFDAEVFLLFSDGINNFGDATIKFNNKPVHCINSSPVANQTFLKETASKSGGRYIDLFNADLVTAMAEFNKPRKYLLSVTTGNNTTIPTISLPVFFTDWLSIAGEVKPGTDKLVLTYGDNGKITSEEEIYLYADTTTNNSLQEVNMLQQLSYLRKIETEQVLHQFATLHKIVTKTTSFIVLDNLMDYIEYAIEPPQDLQEAYKKMTEEVNRRKRQKEEADASEIISNLEKSVMLYNERIKWWHKDEPLLNLKEVNKIYKEGIDGTGKSAEDKADNPIENTIVSNDGLKLGNVSLSEVVVVGYSAQRRRDITGSVTVISSSTLNNSATVAQALQGRVAGVSIVQNNNNTGDVPRIYIRGANSIGANREPLYVLDGIPVDAEMIATMNTANIESITVFKDIQASMLYGSRASNGAIVIVSKQTFRNSYQYRQGITKYKDLEDVEYVSELNDAGKDKLYERYLEMKDSLGKQPTFYFDAAQILFEAGEKQKALRVLTNLAELNAENHQLLRGMGYVLENWGLYDKAIEVYKRVLEIKEEEPQSYRDLALAFERNGQHQQAIDLLYQSLTKNWFQYESRYRGLKSMLLNEMNAIINRNKQSIDLTKINAGILRPLPVDLRIVVDWNKDETDIDLHIEEPGGEVCSYSNRSTKTGGRLSEDFTQGYGPEEYEIKEARKGKYSIRVNYYGDRYQKEQVPSFIKLTIYKNFGRPNQSVTTQTLVMDQQQGMIEIGEVSGKRKFIATTDPTILSLLAWFD